MAVTYNFIASTSLTSQSSVTFSSISQAYTDLILVISATAADGRGANIRVGNNTVDTGTNYSRTGITGNGSSGASYRGSNESYFYTDNAADSSTAGIDIIHFMNYANITTYKTFINRSGTTNSHTRAVVGLWRSTAAINTIEVSIPTSYTGGSATLYGIKAA